MAHTGLIKVILHGRPTYIRASTISRYLPCLWRRYVRRVPFVMSLRPANYLREVRLDQYTRRALRTLVEYLEDVDDGPGKSLHLFESLEDAWKTPVTRRRAGERTFAALGHVFQPDNFGCNSEIWSTMETFVILHCADIVEDSAMPWTEYIRILDAMDEWQRFDLTDVLQRFIWLKNIRLQDLHDVHWIGKMGSRPLKHLEMLIRQKDSIIYSFENRTLCWNCLSTALQRGQYLPWRNNWVKNFERRGGKTLRWFEYPGDALGPPDQCENCFRTFGPLPARRWELPRICEPGLLAQAPLGDNYEIDRDARGFFGGIRPDIPRFMQPFVQEAGHWHPRHGHRVEVMS